MKTKRQPIASAKVGKSFVSLDNHTVTFRTNVQILTDYVPSKRQVINAKVEPWMILPQFIKEEQKKKAINHLVRSLGMNPNYNDTFAHPFKN